MRENLTCTADVEKQALWKRVFTTTTTVLFFHRTDYIFTPGYLTKHWQYYVFISTWGLAITALVASTWVYPKWVWEYLRTTRARVAFLGFALVFYSGVLSLALYEPVRKTWRSWVGAARAMMIWEPFVAFQWGVNNIAMSVANQMDFMRWDDKWIPPIVSTVVGGLIIVVSMCIKLFSIGTLGLDAWYWRDMLLDKPFEKPPTSWPYTDYKVSDKISIPAVSDAQTKVGRWCAFGASILHRSTAGLIFNAIDYTGLNYFFTTVVEEPFVEKNYRQSEK